MARETKEERLTRQLARQLNDAKWTINNLAKERDNLNSALTTARELNESLRHDVYARDVLLRKQEQDEKELRSEISCLRTENEQYRRVSHRLHDHREALLDALTEAKGQRSDL